MNVVLVLRVVILILEVVLVIRLVCSLGMIKPILLIQLRWLVLKLESPVASVRIRVLPHMVPSEMDHVPREEMVIATLLVQVTPAILKMDHVLALVLVKLTRVTSEMSHVRQEEIAQPPPRHLLVQPTRVPLVIGAALPVYLVQLTRVILEMTVGKSVSYF